MENYENEVFGFGEKQNDVADNFNYENISGLGESNYENEDLFANIPTVEDSIANTPEVDTSSEPQNIPNFYTDLNPNGENLYNNIFDLNASDFVDNTETPVETAEPVVEQPVEENVVWDGMQAVEAPTIEEVQPVVEEAPTIEPVIEAPVEETPVVEESPTIEPVPTIEPMVEEQTPAMEIPTIETPVVPVEWGEMPTVETTEEVPVETTEPVVAETPTVEETTETSEENNDWGEMSTIESVTEEDGGNEVAPEIPAVENVEEIQPIEEEATNNMYSAPDASPDITMPGTPIDELQKLTEYEEEEIDTTDINSLFDKISLNVKDASEIFRKNTTLKQKIDTRFEELKALQSELTNSRKKQMEEIDKYKDEVIEKLTEKKEEIEKRLNTLKELQATLEKEKTEFEEYKRTEQANISKIQKQVQNAYDERREELEHIEDVLRKQKDSLDEERNQLSLDKIQYEADKNELANNLIKFNQIVNSFTSGLDIKNEE